MAARALADVFATVEQQAAMWGPAVPLTLRRPIPYDTSDSSKPGMLPELLQPAESVTESEPLFERAWDALDSGMEASMQSAKMVLLSGVSGSGKSKVAFDIGRKHAFVVLVRIWENMDKTPAWALLKHILSKLQAQWRRSTTADADADAGAAPLTVRERDSALACVLLLLACHLEWALMAYGAAKAKQAETAAAAGGAGGAAGAGVVDERALREVVLRVQRANMGQDAVCTLFKLRLQEVLNDDANCATDGRVMVPLEAVLDRLHKLNAEIPAGTPVVWCHDEVQELLNDTSFDGFFEGVFDAPSAPASTRSSSRSSSPGSAAGAVASTGNHRMFAKGDQRVFIPHVDDQQAGGGPPCPRGLFYALLAAMRTLMRHFGWGQLLCGSALRLNLDLLQSNSPAQGVAASMDADTRLDVPALRALLSSYLTPAAALGLDDAGLAKLVGRPLYASMFFHCLRSVLRRLSAGTVAVDPAACARAALAQAATVASRDARARVMRLWTSSFNTVSGEKPHTLVAWLYYLQRMGFGSTAAIVPPSQSDEVMRSVQRGVLHVGRDDAVIKLDDEPITRDAIIAVGDSITAAARSRGQDSVLTALARRVTGAFGDSNVKGFVAEDVLAWTLLREASGRSMPLASLLQPFLPPAFDFPSELSEHTVQLTRGLACDVALGAASSERTFLELFARGGGETALLHRTQPSAGGADLAFLARRPGLEAGQPPRWRLVLLQVSSTSAHKMLRSLDLGQWYPDWQPKGKALETASHQALRRVLAEHPDWADPVRVLVSARPWAKSACEAAACMNASYVTAQPIVLAHLSKDAVGVDVAQGAAQGAGNVSAPKDSLSWWPTRVRHWPADVAHPQQDTLPLPPEVPPVLQSRLKGI